MNIVKQWYPFIFIFIVVCICFYKIIFFGQVLYGTFDNFDYIAPLKYFLVQQITHGHFPLWNPYVDIGVPYIADMTAGTFSIFTVFYLFLPVFRAISWIAVVATLLLAIFQYAYLRILKISKMGSLLGALMMAFNGSIFPITGAVDSLPVIVFIPILFSFAWQFVRKKQIKYFFLLILFQALQLCSGHPRPSYYTILFLSFFFLFWSDFAFKKRLMILITYWLDSFLLASIQLLPLLENVFHSTRPLGSLVYASSGSLTFAHLITFLFPTFYGLHAFGTWWGPQIELYGYMTVPGLFFLYYGIRHGKILKKSFFLISLTVSLLIALGKITPLFWLFYYVIPGVKQFRDPIDVMILFIFFATILIALGYDYALKHVHKLFPVAKRAVIVSSIVIIPLLLLFAVSQKKDFWRLFLTFLFQKMHVHILSTLLRYDSQKLQTIFGGILGNIMFFVLFCFVTGFLFVIFQKKKQLIAWAFIIFVSATFIYFDSSMLMTTSLSSLSVPTALPLVTDAQLGAYRILSLPIDLHQKREHLAIPDFFYQESLAKLETLQANLNMMAHLYQVRGFTTLVPDTFAGFIHKDNATIIDINFSHVTQEQLNQSSVKYIISHDPITSFSAKLSFVGENPGKYYVYKNETAYKRAYLLHNLSVKTFLQQINPDEIVIHTDAPTADTLIVTNWFYPGWLAFVNNKQVPLQAYLGTFQEINIPKGISSVRLAYKPVSFIYGLWMSSITLVVFTILFIAFFKKKV